MPKGWAGNLLVDGMFAGGWKIERSKDSAHLSIELGRKLSGSDLDDVTAEGSKLLEVTDPTFARHEVEVALS